MVSLVKNVLILTLVFVLIIFWSSKNSELQAMRCCGYFPEI